LFDRRWLVVDGTGCSMPDTLENQDRWPQSAWQKPGCGFPTANSSAVENWSGFIAARRSSSAIVPWLPAAITGMFLSRSAPMAARPSRDYQKRRDAMPVLTFWGNMSACTLWAGRNMIPTREIKYRPMMVAPISLILAKQGTGTSMPLTKHSIIPLSTQSYQTMIGLHTKGGVGSIKTW